MQSKRKRIFIEWGIGNDWLLSSEIEYSDGSEERVRGLVWPEHVVAPYLRVWIGYVVMGIGRQGVFFTPKRRWAFKLLLGLEGWNQE
jgi:hypothetical protein